MPPGSFERAEDVITGSPTLPILFHFHPIPSKPSVAKKAARKMCVLPLTDLKHNSEEIIKCLENCKDVYNNRQPLFPAIIHFIIYLSKDVTQLSSYIRRSLHPIMGLSFVSFVSKEPKLRRVAQALYNADIYRTGDVLQLTADQIKLITDATPDEINDLEHFLENGELRLKLGARVIGWQSAYPGAGRAR